MIMEHKNGILTFLFAWCPGAGQMYLGYMKRDVYKRQAGTRTAPWPR